MIVCNICEYKVCRAVSKWIKVHLVEFEYLPFTRIQDESYRIGDQQLLWWLWALTSCLCLLIWLLSGKKEFQFATNLLITQRAKPAATQISVRIKPMVNVHPSYNIASILPRNKSSNVTFLLIHFG